MTLTDLLASVLFLLLSVSRVCFAAISLAGVNASLNNIGVLKYHIYHNEPGLSFVTRGQTSRQVSFFASSPSVQVVLQVLRFDWGQACKYCKSMRVNQGYLL